MFGLEILDVVIGLIFIYLLLAIAVSAAHEFGAAWTRKRAKLLKVGIDTLLYDPAVAVRGFVAAARASRAPSPGRQAAEADGEKTLSEAMYAHPLITALYRGDRLPSYIPARTFAHTLLDVVAGRKEGAAMRFSDYRAAIEKLPPESEIRRALLVLVDDADESAEKLRDNVEIWYNNSMDRVTGWYKQRTQLIILALSAALAVVLNVDTLVIARALQNDSALREAVVAQAQAYAADPANRPRADTVPRDTVPEDTARAQLKRSIGLMQELGVPLGWSEAEQKRLGMDAFARASFPDKFARGFQVVVAFLSPSNWQKIFGLLLTTLAVSLGAPFWFDMLNKVVNVRTAGRAPDEKAKSPEAPAKRFEEKPTK